jgi:hypothetical protein
MEPERFGESSYSIDTGSGPQILDDVQWADWSSDGSLLVATKAGQLQWRDGDGREVRWEAGLAALTPERTPPPPDARQW